MRPVTKLDRLVAALARIGGMQMDMVAGQTRKEIAWLDWVTETRGHPYVSHVVSLSAARYARASVGRQTDTLDACTLIWKDRN